MNKTVLVSGGSGYIAGFIIQQLLSEGWTVHTTVRSLTREAALRPLLGGTDETLKFFRRRSHGRSWLGRSHGRMQPRPSCRITLQQRSPQA